MRIFIISLLSLLLSTSVLSAKKTYGKILYGGQGIYSLDMSNGKSMAIASLPTSSINEISNIDNVNVLISLFDLAPSKNRSRIEIYNLKSKKSNVLLSGTNGVYIPHYGKIIFYNKKRKLSIASISLNSNTIEVIDTFSNPFPVSIVPISNSEFLYESERDGSHGIWKYNLESRVAEKLFGLDECSLSHAIWRSSTSELLCSEIIENGQFTGRYFLTNLVGDKHSYINFGKGEFWPVSYVGSMDSIVLQERTASLLKGEQHPVYIYSFFDGSKMKVSEDNYLSGSVIYSLNN